MVWNNIGDCYWHDYSCWRPRPSQRDFILEIVSKHPSFDGRALKKYAAEGIDTIGCWGDEPFEVHFHNKSFEDVQVRISLDGTDILTGKPANLEVNNDMWVVRAGRTLYLKAWAENNMGGARFVFTSGDKSVALHAHGDISHKGIISAAVFTERDRPYRPEPKRFAERRMKSTAPVGGAMLDIDYYSLNNISENNISDDKSMKSFKKEAAVGAGEYVEQKTKTVKGLDNPVLNSVVRVRYMWWDDLIATLKNARNEDPYPTGFPAEKIKTFADLSGVPRVESVAATRVEATKRRVELQNEPTFNFDRFV